MARQRDYKAEYRRRQELAKERGQGTYANQRKNLSTGKAKLVKGKVVATPTSSFKKSDPAWKKAGASDAAEYMEMKKEIKTWMKTHSKNARSFLTADELKNPELMRAYYDAYVSKKRKPGSLRDFLVNKTGRVSQKEWEKNYAKRFKASKK